MKNEILKVFIGYDPVEKVAFHTMVQSLINHSTAPLQIMPVNLRNFKKFYNRKTDPKQSNEFSFSRFLVPYLTNFSGYAVFFDCDMMLRVDPVKILDGINDSHAVSVVKHKYEPNDDIKYLGTIQYAYPRKNWSSVIVWNCSHEKNKVLTPGYIEESSGLHLHRFKWLEDHEIGELDIEWNWLVGEYKLNTEEIKNVHWTVGGPYFKEYSKVDFSDEWRELHKEINYCKQR